MVPLTKLISPGINQVFALQRRVAVDTARQDPFNIAFGMVRLSLKYIEAGYVYGLTAGGTKKMLWMPGRP